MLRALRLRFSQLPDAQDPEFNGIAAAACLLDPSVASTLLCPDIRYEFTAQWCKAILGRFPLEDGE